MTRSAALIAAFSLVTLCVVIAVFAILRKIHLRRKRQPSLQCAAAKKNDITSQPCDDIQITITESQRRVSKTLSLWCNKLVGRTESQPHDSNLVMDSLDTYLLSLHHVGSKIESLSLSVCVRKYATNRFEKCISTIGRLGIEELYLECHCPGGTVATSHAISFSCHLFTEMPSLKSFKLWYCSLHPNLRSQSNSSLQYLELSYVVICPGAIECILSTCVMLQSLTIDNSKLPSKLSFRGINLELKSLYLFYCQNVEEIEFYASNLVTFDFASSQGLVNFVFKHAPKLESILFDLCEKSNVPYVCQKLARDLPHLKILNVIGVGDCFMESIQSLGIINMSNNLRRINVCIFCRPKKKIDLLLLTLLLQSCPLLQEFHVNNTVIEYDESGGGEKKAIVYHKELKKVAINGFEGVENEIEFALYILKSATSLEEMVISRLPKYYLAPGKWELASRPDWSQWMCTMINLQLQGKAVSKTAKVILQTLPLFENINGNFM